MSLLCSGFFQGGLLWPERNKEEISYNKGSETLERVTQRGSGGPIPRNIPGQIGWGSEQPGLVEDVPAHCRVVGPRWPLKVTSNPKHSMKSEMLSSWRIIVSDQPRVLPCLLSPSYVPALSWPPTGSSTSQGFPSEPCLWESCVVKTLLAQQTKNGRGELTPAPTTILVLPPLRFPPALSFSAETKTG